MSATSPRSTLDSGDRLWFKIGAFALWLGIIVSFVASSMHPSRANPNDNPAAFAEYAADAGWVTTHLLQALGAILIQLVGSLSIYRSLQGETTRVQGLARLGLAVSIIAVAIYMVDMGVDGIALKRAVDRWASASASDKAAYFAVAEGIRWLEYGVLGFAGEFQGYTVFFFALGMAFSATYPKWLGWVGAVGSLVFAIPGMLIFWGGFTAVQQIGAQIGFFTMLFWFIAAAVKLWRL